MVENLLTGGRITSYCVSLPQGCQIARERSKPHRQTPVSNSMNPQELSPYPVMCYAKGCPREAVYKIAAGWSDGVTSELKTYFLACETCLPELYRAAKVKKSACRLAAGETLR